MRIQYGVGLVFAVLFIVSACENNDMPNGLGPETEDTVYITLTTLYHTQSNGDAHNNNTESLTFKISTGMQGAQGTYGWTFTGPGKFFSFDLNTNSDTGLPLPGVYSVSDGTGSNYTFDPGFYYDSGLGYGWNSGTFLVTVDAAGTETPTFITGGTITLEQIAEEYQVTAVVQDNRENIYHISYQGSLTIFQGDGIVLRDQVISSDILDRDILYSVYLPEDYDESNIDYPVLYLLHGYNFEDPWSETNQNGWLDGGNVKYATWEAIENSDISGVIVIMPNAYNSFYENGYISGFNYEDFFFQEFIPAIESTYRIQSDRNKRAIAGLSMGGYGALFYGVKHRDMFCYAYAMSPAVSSANNSIAYMISSLGDPGSLPGITIEIGTEDFLIASVEEFITQLENLSVEHEYITRPGTHSWVFWSACYPKVLQKLGELGF